MLNTPPRLGLSTRINLQTCSNSLSSMCPNPKMLNKPYNRRLIVLTENCNYSNTFHILHIDNNTFEAGAQAVLMIQTAKEHAPTPFRILKAVQVVRNWNNGQAATSEIAFVRSCRVLHFMKPICAPVFSSTSW